MRVLAGGSAPMWARGLTPATPSGLREYQHRPIRVGDPWSTRFRFPVPLFALSPEGQAALARITAKPNRDSALLQGRG